MSKITSLHVHHAFWYISCRHCAVVARFSASTYVLERFTFLCCTGRRVAELEMHLLLSQVCIVDRSFQFQRYSFTINEDKFSLFVRTFSRLERFVSCFRTCWFPLLCSIQVFVIIVCFDDFYFILFIYFFSYDLYNFICIYLVMLFVFIFFIYLAANVISFRVLTVHCHISSLEAI